MDHWIIFLIINYHVKIINKMVTVIENTFEVYMEVISIVSINLIKNKKVPHPGIEPGPPG